MKFPNLAQLARAVLHPRKPSPRTPPAQAPTNTVLIAVRETWFDLFRHTLHALLRWTYTLAVFGGCTYLVFWRMESGWLFLPACLLILFRRGL